jgi:hypothetical protein
MTLHRKKFSFWLLTLTASLTPFTSSSALVIFRKIPPLEQELGCSPTLSRIFNKPNYYFDPFELATDDNFARYRECELKHGRVCMLASTLGMVLPHVYSIVSSKVTFLPKLSIPKTALQSLESMSVRDYLRILVTCAVLEAFVFVQQQPTDMPGDYGVGYFGVRDKGENERALVVELENGRLAMVAFLVQIVLEQTTGMNVVEQWENALATIVSKSSATIIQ